MATSTNLKGVVKSGVAGQCACCLLPFGIFLLFPGAVCLGMSYSLAGDDFFEDDSK